MAGVAGYTYNGCYPDGEARLLDDAYFNSSSMTIQVCCAYCTGFEGHSSNQFYRLAGVENGNECYCGSNYAFDPGEKNQGACKINCFGDSTQSCGGNGYIAIYNATVTPSNITPLSTFSATSTTPGTAVTEGPTSTPSTSPTPQRQTVQTSPTLIAVSVIVGILALALSIISGLWFLRKNERRSKHQSGRKNPPSDARTPELDGTAVSSSQSHG